jgi:hypothetical protein
MECWSGGTIRLRALLQYSDTQTKRILWLVLVAMLLALSSSAHAQQPKKIPRVGYLSGTGSEAPTVVGFRRGYLISVTLRNRNAHGAKRKGQKRELCLLVL